MRSSIPVALCAAAALVGWATPAAAASLDACGEIHVEASASCRVEVGGGCKSKCTPLNFVTTCRTKRYNACRNECTVQAPSVDCEADCSADCSGSCTGTPGALYCQTDCHGRCMTDCKAYCTGSSCEASCDATCTGECEATCTAVAPTATCEASCEASCGGSCTITAPYIECQTKCQERQYQECETELQGGCETQCTKPEGALFCDDQFIDHGGKLEECVDALNGLLTGQVDVSSSGSLRYECDGAGTCKLVIGGSISTGCATAPADASAALPALLLLAGVLVVARARRSRR